MKTIFGVTLCLAFLFLFIFIGCGAPQEECDGIELELEETLAELDFTVTLLEKAQKDLKETREELDRTTKTREQLSKSYKESKEDLVDVNQELENLKLTIKEKEFTSTNTKSAAYDAVHMHISENVFCHQGIWDNLCAEYLVLLDDKDYWDGADGYWEYTVYIYTNLQSGGVFGYSYTKEVSTGKPVIWLQWIIRSDMTVYPKDYSAERAEELVRCQ